MNKHEKEDSCSIVRAVLKIMMQIKKEESLMREHQLHNNL